MFVYTRKVHYHETDKMAIVHHTNYIKWMEETRTEFLEANGMPFAQMEELGVGSPVVTMDVKYKRPATFGDTCDIEFTVKSYNGIRAIFDYVIKNKETGEVLVTAESSHCFIKTGGRVCSLAKELPDWHERFLKAVEANRLTED